MAYSEAVVKGIEPNQDGSQRVLVVFIGDAGEPPVSDTLTISVSTVPDQTFLRRYAIGKLTTLNATKTFKSLIEPGMVIDTRPLPVDPPPDPALTDWLMKHQDYLAAQKAVAFGYASQSVLDDARAAAVKAYQPSFFIYLRSA